MLPAENCNKRPVYFDRAMTMAQQISCACCPGCQEYTVWAMMKVAIRNKKKSNSARPVLMSQDLTSCLARLGV